MYLLYLLYVSNNHQSEPLTVHIAQAIIYKVTFFYHFTTPELKN